MTAHSWNSSLCVCYLLCTYIDLGGSSKETPQPCSVNYHIDLMEQYWWFSPASQSDFCSRVDPSLGQDISPVLAVFV